MSEKRKRRENIITALLIAGMCIVVGGTIIFVIKFSRGGDENKLLSAGMTEATDVSLESVTDVVSTTSVTSETTAPETSETTEETKNFDGMILNLAINYGGRDEIIRGIKKIVSSNVSEDKITEKFISETLDLPQSPDVDLLIRTGGEFRLSNFLLWHIPYAEQIYTETLWPDYTTEEFLKHIQSFKHRNRRFGAEK